MLSECPEMEKHDIKILNNNLDISCSRFLGWFTEGVVLGVFNGLASAQSLTIMFASFFHVDFASLQQAARFVISQLVSAPALLIVSYSKKLKVLIMKVSLDTDLNGLNIEMVSIHRMDKHALIRSQSGEYICEGYNKELLRKSVHLERSCVFNIYKVQNPEVLHS
jgi:hypothetical protein